MPSWSSPISGALPLLNPLFFRLNSGEVQTPLGEGGMLFSKKGSFSQDRKIGWMCI